MGLGFRLTDMRSCVPQGCREEAWGQCLRRRHIRQERGLRRTWELSTVGLGMLISSGRGWPERHDMLRFISIWLLSHIVSTPWQVPAWLLLHRQLPDRPVLWQMHARELQGIMVLEKNVLGGSGHWRAVSITKHEHGGLDIVVLWLLE